MNEAIVLEKFVHGGQAIATLADGRKVFVWGGLPGEKVRIQLTKKKKSWAEGIVTEVLEPSSERVDPNDPSTFLATSPWQIVDFKAENKYKKQILEEHFAFAKVELPDFEFVAGGSDYHYRNKMEYSFWADDDGLHLALYNRGSHLKMIVEGSSIAMPEIDTAAQDLLHELNVHKIEGRQLKTIILRATQKGEVAAALFTKDEKFPEVEMPTSLQGLRVYYSNPKSPASVMTKLLYEQGTAELADTILGKKFVYDVDSFFQVNVPIYEKALQKMQEFVSDDEHIVDMYAGVGTIGLSLGRASELVEIDPATAAMARRNAVGRAEVIETSTEKALDYITPDRTIIFDPPRAGLHEKVVERLLDVQPKKILYLSCNPATQARDLGLLQEKYKITFFEGYNFFPHTPHIESLAVLTSEIVSEEH